MDLRIDRRPWLWLALGGALVVLTHHRWGLGILAFLAPIPLLRYLRLSRGWASRLLFLTVHWIAWTAATAKIVTAEVPLVMAPLFALPTSLLLGVAYLVHERVRPLLSPALGTLVFPAMTAVMEWVQFTFTPLGTWGAGANAQLDNLPLLQLAALTGLTGVGFLVHWLASVAEAALARGIAPVKRVAVAAAVAFLVAMGAGAVRLSVTSGQSRERVLVAAVGTDSTVAGLPLPSRSDTARWDDALARRTRRAARAGARLVVWPEVGTLVRPEDEPRWTRDTSALARSLGIYLVAAYVMPRQGKTFTYDNKYVLFQPDGSVAHRYHKLHPVPGEPVLPGAGPAPRVSTPFGVVSGAICYDYDFPSAARSLASQSVDLVALPSSDWRGIDPLHTEMARLRAIESGHSILRSTRWGLSAGIDTEGRIVGSLSHFDGKDRVLLVGLPVRGVVTPYALLGDWFPVACGGLVLLAPLGVWWRRWRRGTSREPTGDEPARSQG